MFFAGIVCFSWDLVFLLFCAKVGFVCEGVFLLFCAILVVSVSGAGEG